MARKNILLLLFFVGMFSTVITFCMDKCQERDREMLPTVCILDGLASIGLMSKESSCKWQLCLFKNLESGKFTWQKRTRFDGGGFKVFMGEFDNCQDEPEKMYLCFLRQELEKSLEVMKEKQRKKISNI